MQFKIDGKRYVVRVASSVLTLNGEPCRAKLDRPRRVIWLSPQLPRHERRRELLHELRHAWVDAHGVPGDEEADAAQAAEMMDVLMRQYQEQGGDDTLEALNPPADAPVHRSASGPLAETETMCGFCGARVAPGSILGDPPEWMDELNVWAIQRGMLCGVCDSVTVWREVSTAEGVPKGQLVAHPPPRVLSRAETRKWVTEHQEFCRVRLVTD